MYDFTVVTLKKYIYMKRNDVVFYILFLQSVSVSKMSILVVPRIAVEPHLLL